MNSPAPPPLPAAPPPRNRLVIESLDLLCTDQFFWDLAGEALDGEAIY